jgi:hypothetical protein
MPPLEWKIVDQDELRRLFNEQRIYERAQTGEFSERVIWEGRRRRPSGAMP